MQSISEMEGGNSGGGIAGFPNDSSYCKCNHECFLPFIGLLNREGYKDRTGIPRAGKYASEHGHVAKRNKEIRRVKQQPLRDQTLLAHSLTPQVLIACNSKDAGGRARRLMIWC